MSSGQRRKNGQRSMRSKKKQMLVRMLDIRYNFIQTVTNDRIPELPSFLVFLLILPSMV